MSLINREVLIKKAYDEAKGMAEPYDDFGVLVEWLVDKLPTIEPEPHWIPVSEKAHPDLPVRVQVQMSNGWIITAYYQDGEWLSVPNCEEAIHDEWIEAWRELPEPYREEGEK